MTATSHPDLSDSNARLLRRAVLIEDESGNRISSSNPLSVDVQTLEPLEGDVGHGSVSITTTSTEIASSPLLERKAFALYNNSTSTVFIGGSSVSSSDGYPLRPKESITIDLGDGLSIYGIVSSGTADVRYLELS